MTAMFDLAGQVFGRLKVREKTIYQKPNAAESHKKKTWWLCDCSCGAETVQPSYAIRNGMVASCGCLRRENGRNEMRWDDAAFDRLRDLWFDHSMSISDMGTEMGLTKNSIKGAAERIGLPPRLTFLNAPKQPPKVERSPLHTLPVCRPEVPVVSRIPLPPLTAIDLFNWRPCGNVVQFKLVKKGQCEWLDGESPRTFLRCERMIERGSYCEAHAKICYLPRSAVA